MLMMPTSAESGRRSVTPRPSMRTPSFTMRSRTTCFCSERNAFLTSPSRPANWPGSSGVPAAASSRPSRISSSRLLRSVLSAIAMASAVFGLRLAGDRLEHVVLVVDPRLERLRHDRTVGEDDRGDELLLEVDRLADPLLGDVETLGDDLLGHLRCAGLVELPALLGATGLDHHHGDLAGVGATARDDELERGLGALLVGRVGDPLTLVVRHAHRADRTVERDARDHQRGGRAVDRDDVVRVHLVRAEDRGDDLGLVAEALGEARPQRPVGEAAGEDRGLTRATFTTEERAGDLARGVHPLLDVHRQGEEVDALTGLAGGDRRQDDGVADGQDDRAVGEVAPDLPVSMVSSSPSALIGPLTRIASPMGTRSSLAARLRGGTCARGGGSQLSALRTSGLEHRRLTTSVTARVGVITRSGSGIGRSHDSATGGDPASRSVPDTARCRCAGGNPADDGVGPRA